MGSALPCFAPPIRNRVWMKVCCKVLWNAVKEPPGMKKVCPLPLFAQSTLPTGGVAGTTESKGFATPTGNVKEASCYFPTRNRPFENSRKITIRKKALLSLCLHKSASQSFDTIYWRKHCNHNILSYPGRACIHLQCPAGRKKRVVPALDALAKWATGVQQH